MAQLVKNPPAIQDGKGNGNPLQYSCLENPMDRGPWWAAVYGVTLCCLWVSLSSFTFIKSHTRLKQLSSSSNVRDWGSIPRLGGSLKRERVPTPGFWPGEFHGVHGVTKSRTRLNDFHFHLYMDIKEYLHRIYAV